MALPWAVELRPFRPHLSRRDLNPRALREAILQMIATADLEAANRLRAARFEDTY
jgi:hypothetical protein